MMLKRTIIFLTIIFFGICNYSFSQSRITNVDFRTTPDNQIKITYDLSGYPSDARFTVWVKVSLDNGRSYELIPKSLTGDVGKSVSPGRNKKIIWDVFQDTPVLIAGNMVIAVMAKENARRVPKKKTAKQTRYKDMVFVQGGEFLMGSNDGDDDEKPIHKVKISSFYMDKYEVTVAKYAKFVKATGHRKPKKWSDQLKSPKKSVVYVSWKDALVYAKWAGGRLPTEAEWEYAARGGCLSKGFLYCGSNDINKVTWYAEHQKSATKRKTNRSHQGTSFGRKAQENINKKRSFLQPGIAAHIGQAAKEKAEQSRKAEKNGRKVNKPRIRISNSIAHFPVGMKQPNELGLYDMSGNVWEWCSDWYKNDYYKKYFSDNPTGPSFGTERVIRGGCGCYVNYSMDCRCANRSRYKPISRSKIVGFRIIKISSP